MTEDITDDMDALSLVSSTSTTAAVTLEMKLSTSSGSETPTWVAMSHSSSTIKPHAPSSDPCWEAIRRVKSETTSLVLEDLRFIKRLGSGDIGSVYLVELKGAEGCLFAAKVMDKEELMTRSKEGRARIEQEILEMLDHPFLPSLYATLDLDRWSCLLTEFCPGGDLHVLRQRQPARRFDEAAVRFYASEIVVAFEYLHMMGIIYRDLKPENVLVRSDGHIMLTDFDLCLKCDDSTSTAQLVTNRSKSCMSGSFASPTSSCILSRCIVPTLTCFNKKPRRRRQPGHRGAMEIVAEPIDARSMSFVGTHEYLAPEIVSGEGHGNAVDWWTLGIFLFELFYGITPFRGLDNEFTLANIVARGLEFPKEPTLSSSMKDLITQLLIKDPMKRMGSTMGATAIKHHTFFDGVNWALLRCASPPFIPCPVTYQDFVVKHDNYDASVEYY